MNIMKRSIVVLLSLYIAACTWVDLSQQGEKVRVLTANEAELNTLARNSAVEIGGDTVVPVDTPLKGRQVFEVYRCMP